MLKASGREVTLYLARPVFKNKGDLPENIDCLWQITELLKLYQ